MKKLENLTRIVREGILALNEPTYGGLDVSKTQADERARNIVQAIVGQYELKDALTAGD